MSKISQYPVKTIFNDTDVYDCSTDIGGGNFESQKIDYLNLKNDILGPQIDKYTIAGISDSGFASDGIFAIGNLTSLSGTMGFLKQNKTLYIFGLITAGIVAGTGSSGRLTINLPPNFATDYPVDPDFCTSSGNGGNASLSQNVECRQGTNVLQPSNGQNSTANIRSGSGFDNIILRTTFVGGTIDVIKWGFNGTLALL